MMVGCRGFDPVVADELSDSRVRVYAVLPWAVDTTLIAGTDLGMDPSEVLKPEYVARKIFEAAKGRKRSGTLIKIYP